LHAQAHESRDHGAAIQRFTDTLLVCVLRTTPGGIKAAFHVGDTPNDLIAALHAGATAVGVATGIYTREQLEQAGREAAAAADTAAAAAAAAAAGTAAAAASSVIVLDDLQDTHAVLKALQLE
jgi:ribonucleotide monophosphatase NagD (HAD superfamily)